MLERLPTRNATLRMTLLIVVLALSVAFVDRPVATYMHHAVYGTPLYDWAMGVFPVLLGAGAGLALLSLAVVATIVLGRPTRPWMTTCVAASGAGVAGLLAAELLKGLIGRSQIYPTYLVDGVYRFSLLHGHPGYGIFPSATATASGAVLLTLWSTWPRGRWACAGAFGIISAALILTNSHWVSDVLGGAVLGGWFGWLMAGRLGTGRVESAARRAE